MELSRLLEADGVVQTCYGIKDMSLASITSPNTSATQADLYNVSSGAVFKLLAVFEIGSTSL